MVVGTGAEVEAAVPLAVITGEEMEVAVTAMVMAVVMAAATMEVALEMVEGGVLQLRKLLLLSFLLC